MGRNCVHGGCEQLGLWEAYIGRVQGYELMEHTHGDRGCVLMSGLGSAKARTKGIGVVESRHGGDASLGSWHDSGGAD